MYLAAATRSVFEMRGVVRVAAVTVLAVASGLIVYSYRFVLPVITLITT